MPPILFFGSIFLFGIFMVCKSGLVGSSSQPDLCVVNSPLITPYFTPLLETPRKSHGCSNPYSSLAARSKIHSHHSNDENLQSQQIVREVHVIALHVNGGLLQMNIRRPTSPIRLTIQLGQKERQESDAEILGRLTLVLHSDRPVTWELIVNYNGDEDNSDFYSTPQPMIVVSEGSTVEGNFGFNLSTKSWSSKKALQRYVKKEFKWIASYTEVKEANHMELKVGSLQNHNETECNMNVLKESQVLTASLMVELNTEGCFHEDYIGDNPVDAYIIELDGSNKRTRPNRAHIPVLIHLHGEGTRPVSRNVTLVLKSHQPIIWQFGANGIHGNIVVVRDNEDQVENAAMGGSQKLEVRSEHLPDKLSDLLILVATHFAPPILYAKTGHASELRLLVGTRSKAGLRSGPEGDLLHENGEVKPGKHWGLKEEESDDGEDRTDEDGNEEGTINSHELMEQQPSYPGAALVSGLTAQEPQTSPLGHLSAAMVLDCGKSRITVSFPASLVKKLGVKRLTLNDGNCVFKENQTHVLFSSLITSCGTTSKSDGKIVSATNAIHITLSSDNENDDEDFDESSGWYREGGSAKLSKIPVECKYHPIIHKPRSGFGDDDDPFVGSDDILNGANSNKMSPYHMEIYRDKEYTQQVDFFSLEPEAREAEFDETLFVRAWIDGAVPVQVVTESCWISNSSNPEDISRFELLRNTCPVDLSVQIHINVESENSTKSQQFAHGGFSFQVNKEYEGLGQLFLHCRLGLCTEDPEYLKGNLIMCVDPKQYCSRHSLRPFLDKTVSTAQQLVSRGPLRLVPRRRKASPQAVPKSTTQVEGRTKIIYVGVSTEVTIGIALASFAIGVGLTGALWCIHMKTDPFRRQADKQLPGTRAVVGTSVTACNLSPHSGCSSTNSQTAMTST